MDHDEKPCASRRQLLCRAAALAVLPLVGRGAEAAGRWVTAGSPSNFPLNRPIEVSLLGGSAIVQITRLTNSRWFGLSAWCTHEGCAVHWKPGRGRYVCPCHGANFARDGRVLHGPANGPLTQLPVAIRKGKVAINLG